MLLEKDEHGFVEYMYVVVAILFGTFSFIVKQGCGNIIIRVACFEKSERKVYVLAIHKKSLVKHTHFL